MWPLLRDMIIILLALFSLLALCTFVQNFTNRHKEEHPECEKTYEADGGGCVACGLKEMCDKK